MSKRKVTFNEEQSACSSKSVANRDNEHASDDDKDDLDTCFGWDNPFQEGEINDDADTILILWRQGLLSSYPFVKLTNSDPDASEDSNNSYIDALNDKMNEAAPSNNDKQINRNSTTKDDKKDFLSSKKIFQTYYKLKKKLMKFNCFVAKQ